MQDTTLAELAGMARWLGEPARDLTILGEGNASAQTGEDTFLVKASGAPLAEIDARGFVEVRRSAVLALLDDPSITSDSYRARLDQAMLDGETSGVPSVETPLHAVCLGLPGVRYVGHTHPTAVNALVCGCDFDAVLSRSVYPDQVVACGPRSLRVGYAEPGVALGRLLRQELADYEQRWRAAPKTIFLRNHGFVALGEDPTEVTALTQMAVKAARVLAGSLAFGGPHAIDDVLQDRSHEPS